MKTVVTGGAGFIGSNLVRELIAQGRDVIVIDDLSRGKITNLPKGADLIELDLTSPQGIIEAIKGADTIFHLAARIGSIDYLHGSDINEFRALQSNLLIDTNVIKASLDCNVKTLVYASSVAVYPPSYRVLSETNLDYRYSNPDGGYGWAKLVGEIQLKWSSGIDIGIARIFNVYGEYSDLAYCPHLITNYIIRALDRKKLEIWGSGLQSRDFIYVTDCVQALLRLEASASMNKPVVNIGSGIATSVKSIADMIARIAGRDIKTSHKLEELVGVPTQTADITLAKALLNWEPEVTLEEGLRHTYDWIKEFK